MQEIKTAHIVFFSGTGGTARVAECLRLALAARGVNATLTELNAHPHPPVRADILLLLYPVYAANAPQPVEEWIAAEPDGNGMSAAVISVSGGGEVSPNTACRVATIRRLTAKGYRVNYERMLVMPGNLLIPFGDALNALLLREAPRRAARIAEDLLSGVIRRTRPHVLDRFLSRVLIVEHRGSRFFGRHLTASAACTGCGWCAAHCPRQNISLQNGKPAYGNRCVFCMRCLYGCPAKAIVPGVGKFTVLKDGFNLNAVETRTESLVEFPPVKTLTKGIAFAGVRKYLLNR